MAKRIKQVRHPNLRHISRLEKERRMRRWLYIGVGATFALVILLLAWGLLDIYVLRPARPVATVGEEAIRTDAYQKLVTYRRYDSQMYLQTLEQQRQQYAGVEGQEFLVDYIDQQIQQVQQSYSLLPTSVLDQMIKDLVIRQEAARRGITVTPDEVQALLEQQFGYDPEAEAAGEIAAALEAAQTPTPVVVPTTALTATEQITGTASITATDVIAATPTPYPTQAPMTLDEFAATSTRFFDTIASEVGYTEAEFERLLESSLYQDKVEEVLKAEMPTTAEQVHARHILVATEDEARQVLERLAAGEAFEALASELSTDTASGADGGDLGWFGRGQMVDAFEAAAFSLEPGTVSEPIATDYGYHVIEVLERDDAHPLEGDALATFQNAQLQAWYGERMSAPDVVRSWTADMVPEDRFTTG